MTEEKICKVKIYMYAVSKRDSWINLNVQILILFYSIRFYKKKDTKMYTSLNLVVN